jgi:pimeloyl-ACP methyl ester carboxylesterase
VGEGILDALEGACERLETPIDAGRIVWRKWGMGPPVILLHGGYGSWRHWVKTIPVLSKTHTLYVPDLPGLGDSSDMPRPASPALVAAFVATGIRTLLPTASELQIVGFSFGANIGGHVAALLGDQVAALILVGPGALGLPRENIALEKWRDESSIDAIRAVHRRNLANLMIADATKIDNLAVEIQLQNARRARLASRKIAAPDSLAATLRRSVPKTLCTIFGECDAIVGGHMPARQALMREIQPHSMFKIIAGAGHWVAFEAPEAFNAALCDVIQ